MEKLITISYDDGTDCLSPVTQDFITAQISRSVQRGTTISDLCPPFAWPGLSWLHLHATDGRSSRCSGPVCEAPENIELRNHLKEREPRSSRRSSVCSMHYYVVSAATSFVLKPKTTLKNSDFYCKIWVFKMFSRCPCLYLKPHAEGKQHSQQ